MEGVFILLILETRVFWRNAETRCGPSVCGLSLVQYVPVLKNKACCFLLTYLCQGFALTYLLLCKNSLISANSNGVHCICVYLFVKWAALCLSVICEHCVAG